MNCLTITYEVSLSTLEATAYVEPSMAADCEVVESDLHADVEVCGCFDVSFSVNPSDLEVMYELSEMVVTFSFEEDFSVDHSIEEDFAVEVGIEDGLQVEVSMESDFHVDFEVIDSDFDVDAAMVCTIPSVGYLDLSRYHIWVLPDYYEYVDVYSNRNWIIN